MFSYDRDGVARASESPADDAYMITAGASPLTLPIRALRVAVGGNLDCRTKAGIDRTLIVLDGETVQCGMTHVYSTGTASGFLGYP